EELNTTNDDLQSRGIELQEAASLLAAERDRFQRERDRLVSIVDSAAEAVAILDGSAGLAFTNTLYRQWFGDHRPVDEDRRAILPPTTRRRSQAGTDKTVFSPLDGSPWRMTMKFIDQNGDRHTVLTLRPSAAERR